MKAYDSTMSQSAAVMVLDELPSEEQIDELIEEHLAAFEDEENIEVRADVSDKAPDWMDICEQDQINAHLRDGGVCVVVLYITVFDGYTDDDD